MYPIFSVKWIYGIIQRAFLMQENKLDFCQPPWLLSFDRFTAKKCL